MNSLPNEIVESILLSLDICEWRSTGCVSKKWQQLTAPFIAGICDPSIIDVGSMINFKERYALKRLSAEAICKFNESCAVRKALSSNDNRIAVVSMVYRQYKSLSFSWAIVGYHWNGIDWE